jgi:inhibitor of cysteine peptidase
VYVTDAPPDEEVTSIMVTVAEVQVHKSAAGQEQEQVQASSDNQTPGQGSGNKNGPKGNGKWITVNTSDNATTFDLLTITGIEQFIGASEVTAGKYTQVRLVLGGVQVALGGGNLQDATVPSRELKLVHPFDIVAGETTAMIIDFEADKMVTVTGAGKILVKPVVNLKVRQEKSSGEKGGQESNNETANEVTVEVTCDEFVNTQHVEKEVEVNVNDMVNVILCSNQSTGFQWVELAVIEDTTVIEQINHKYKAPKIKGKKPPTPGSPGQEIWTFRTLKEGMTTISMEYSRPWEGGEKKEWTFALKVVVK